MLDIVLLSVSTVVVLLLTEGGVTRSFLSLLTVFQAVITILALRRWVPGIWGTGGRVPFKRLREFGLVLLVVMATALVTALIRSLLGLVIFPDESLDLLIGRWGRNAASMATIGTFGLLLGGWIAEHRDQGTPRSRATHQDRRVARCGHRRRGRWPWACSGSGTTPPSRPPSS